MRFRERAIVGTLLLFLSPVGSFAAAAPQSYKQVTGPFETQEEAEAACMEAAGLDESSIRLFTGNIGNLWKLDNPLTFLVRRCLNNVKKHEQNLQKGAIHIDRTRERARKLLSDLSQEKIQRTNKNENKNIYRNVRMRASQQMTGPKERIGSFVNSRSAGRVETRTTERDLRSKLDQKRFLQKEAEEACRNQWGTQHVMCIRREVREREEALENE